MKRYMYLETKDFNNWKHTMYNKLKKDSRFAMHTNGNYTFIVNLKNGKSYSVRLSPKTMRDDEIAFAICYAKATNKRIAVQVRRAFKSDIRVNNTIICKDLKKTKKIVLDDISTQLLNRGFDNFRLFVSVW